MNFMEYIFCNAIIKFVSTSEWFCPLLLITFISIISLLKCKETTKQVEIRENQKTKRTEIISKAILGNIDSLPPDDIKKQNTDNLIYYMDILKQRNNETLSEIEYQTKPTLPVYDSVSDSQTVTINNENNLIKLFLKTFPNSKDDNDDD